MTGENDLLRRRTVLTTIGAGIATPAVTGLGTANGGIQRVVDFEDFGPENLAVDSDGNIYMSMGLTGEVRKLPAETAASTGLDVGDTEVIAELNTGEEGFLTGIVEDDCVLFAALSSFDESTHGVWQIEETTGDAERIAALDPENTLPNGIIVEPTGDGLLVSDSLGGRIWRIDRDEGDEDDAAEEWLTHDLLAPDFDTEFITPIGANGLAVDEHDDVFVANTDFGRVVRVPVDTEGAPVEDEVEPYVEDEDLVGADGITFHNGTMLYVAVNRQNTVVRVTPSGEIITLASEDDGLDFPADVAFGTAGRISGRLFIANFALVSEDPDPSLMRTHP